MYGNTVRLIRQSRKMSQKDLAEMIGLSGGFLSLAERGLREFTLSQIIEICNIFGIPVTALVFMAEYSSLQEQYPQFVKQNSDFLMSILFRSHQS